MTIVDFSRARKGVSMSLLKHSETEKELFLIPDILGVESETALVETTSYISDERFDNDPDFHHCRLNLFFRVELEWKEEIVEEREVLRYTLVGNEWVPARRNIRRRKMILKHAALIVPGDIWQGEHWLRYRRGDGLMEFNFVIWTVYEELLQATFSRKPKKRIPFRYEMPLVYPEKIDTPRYAFDYYQKELMRRYGHDAERVSSIVDAPVLKYSNEICRQIRA